MKKQLARAGSLVIMISFGLTHQSIQASGIGNDNFDVTIDGNTFSGIAQSTPGRECDTFDGSNCDAYDGDQFVVDWINGNTFQVGFNDNPPPENTRILLSDLQFTDGLGAVDITTARFNENGPHATFLESPENPGGVSGFVNPLVTTTANSVTIELITTSAFGGDGPLFEFDVSTTATAVPAPAGYLLFLVGLAGLGFKRSRLSTSAA